MQTGIHGMTSPQLRLGAAALALAASLAACKDKGGGRSEEPDANAPINRPPSLAVNVRTPDVFEDRPIVIDLDGTIDPDGDPVFPEVTQLSGPTATFSSSDGPVFTWQAPFVSGSRTETLTFEASASDGNGGTATQQITIRVRGDDGRGVGIAILDQGTELLTGTFSEDDNEDEAFDVRLTRPARGGAPNAKEIVYLPTGESDSFASWVEPVVSLPSGSVDSVDWDALADNGINSGGRYQFLLASEDRDTVEWYRTETVGGRERGMMAVEIDVESPCTTVAYDDGSRNRLFVGRRTSGLSVIELSPTPASDGSSLRFDYSVVQELGQGRSLCDLLPTDLPSRYGTSGLVDLIAVDHASNTLLLLGDTDDDGAYEQLDMVALDVQSTTPLRIVDVVTAGSPDKAPRFLAVLLSDGRHNGIHRMIHVTQDNTTREISQRTYSWNGGAPIALLRGPFSGALPGNQFRQDLVAISGTSSQSVYFDNILDGSAAASAQPVFGEATPFNLLSGASSAVTVAFFDGAFTQYGVLASFPEERSLRYFNVTE